MEVCTWEVDQFINLAFLDIDWAGEYYFSYISYYSSRMKCISDDIANELIVGIIIMWWWLYYKHYYYYYYNSYCHCYHLHTICDSVSLLVYGIPEILWTY